MMVPGRPESVCYGSDREILSWAIPFYLRGRAPRVIVDLTWGRGRMWRGGAFEGDVIGFDRAARRGARARADFASIPLASGCADVVVFDPPHVSEQGERGRLGREDGSGYTSTGGADVTECFPPALSESARVLARGGVVLVKIADQVHRGMSRWQHVEAMHAAERAGLVVCDLLVKVRGHAMNDPKWKRALHARKLHSFWIICRKGRC